MGADAGGRVEVSVGNCGSSFLSDSSFSVR